MAKFIKTELTLNPKVYKKLERIKQNEKVKGHLYKKWKLYAAALGIIIIITSTGLGVSLGVPWHEIFSNLNHLKLNKTAIPGKVNMTQNDAFNAVLENNTKISDLKTNVKPSSFIAPSYTTAGSLTIKAKADGKYNGSVKIKITTIAKIKLSDLNLNTAIPGKVNMTKEDTFDAFLANNSNIIALKDNVAAGAFIQPTYTTSGSLVIKAIPTGKYSGNVTVTITKLRQTNLKDLNLNTILKESITDKQEAFQAFLDLNQEKYPDLKDNTIAGTFTTPNYTQAGSLTVNATPTGKYTGNVTVTITKLTQTNLNDLNLNTNAIPGIENMKAEDAFQAFLTNNSNISDLKNNVEIGTFTAPSYTSTGKLTVNAKTNSKYSGTITVTITKLRQTNLKDLIGIVKEVASSTTENNALQAFLDANKNKYPDLAGNITLDENSFKAPSYTNTGSYTINATTNGKYSGSIEIIIKAIGQTKLSDLNLNTTIPGIENMTAQDAFNQFLTNNSNISDLKNNVEIGTFTAPSYTSTGKLTVNAKTNSKYSGSLEVNINKIKQTDTLSIYLLIRNEYNNKTRYFTDSTKSNMISALKETISFILEKNNYEFIENDWNIIVDNQTSSVIYIHYLNYSKITLFAKFI